MAKKITPRTIGPEQPNTKRKGLLAPVGGANAGVTDIRGAVMLRASQGIRKIVSSSSEAHMLEALTRTTEIDVLIHLLSDPAAMGRAAAQTEDPLRAARARTIEKQMALLQAEGGTLGGAEVAERLRMTRGGVDARRKAGKLLAVEGGSRTLAYPAWQFTDHDVLGGLEQVLAAFHVADSLMRMSFFLTRDPDLDERPLDALRKGKVEDVREAAARFGRFGDEG